MTATQYTDSLSESEMEAVDDLSLSEDFYQKLNQQWSEWMEKKFHGPLIVAPIVIQGARLG